MSEYRSLRDAVWARAWNGGLTGPQLLVALRLVEHWPRMFPGEKTLGRWTRLSERAVRDALHALESMRVIAIARTPGRANTYAFLDVNGNPVVVPDLGTPAPAAGPPRQDVPDTPAPAAAPTPAPAAAEADPDPKQDLKQTREAGSTRALMPHERAEARKAQDETTPGARPVVRYEFRPDWKPKISHRELGFSLGLNDDEIGARLHDCRNKTYEKGFTSEDKQFNRELAWAARDKETAAFKLQNRKASNVRDFEQPGHRRASGG